MKHIVKLSIPPESDQVDGQEVIQVRCNLADIAKLVLALCLLRERLVDSFTIIGGRGVKLEILQKEGLAQAAITRTSDKIEAALPLLSIDMVLNFYLIYYRDGFADVSHVDVETDEGVNGGYLTFFAADSKPPLSAEDLEEHLRNTD
jgi:hypothetical protein